jgi:hypothetical protein
MKHNNDVSRRKFLQTAASAGMVAGLVTSAIPMASMAEATPVSDRSRSEDPLEKILSRYGSELGEVNRTR